MRGASLRRLGKGLIGGARPSKYGNTKVEVGGVKFDSKDEYARWRQLQLLERAGEIRDLRRQVSFELVRAVVIGGRKKPPICYVADFTYEEVRTQARVVEDVKGFATPMYRIKRHLMVAVHGIEIKEFRNGSKHGKK